MKHDGTIALGASLDYIPKMGMFIPKMGRTPARPTGLAGALFTPVQQRVLGLLLGQPDRRFQSAELIRLARSGTGAVHRQLTRLAEAGVVTVSQDGNQKYYQASQSSPVFKELHGLIVKTVGVAEPLRRALATHARGIRAAFVYGSIAKGTDRGSSDIDLMVISDTLRYPMVYEALQAAESMLGRAINPTVMTPADWRGKRSGRDSFATRISRQPRIFILGSDSDLE